MPRIKWFANAWTGFSWVRNMLKGDGGIPCFWTKDNAEISDPFSKAWKLYDEKFPDRGWRITYDKFSTHDAVLSQLYDFLEMHSDEEEVHIWIQGNYRS